MPISTKEFFDKIQNVSKKEAVDLLDMCYYDQKVHGDETAYFIARTTDYDVIMLNRETEETRFLTESEYFDLRISGFVEEGKVLVIESGTDCDGVEYDGKTSIIDATLSAFNQLVEEKHEWADGPFTLRFGKPSDEKNVERTSRDRRAEQYNY